MNMRSLALRYLYRKPIRREHRHNGNHAIQFLILREFLSNVVFRRRCDRERVVLGRINWENPPKKLEIDIKGLSFAMSRYQARETALIYCFWREENASQQSRLPVEDSRHHGACFTARWSKNDDAWPRDG